MSKKRQPVSTAPSQNLNIVLDDLCMRFLVNLPAVEYESFERLFFAIESAHWFYDDFYRACDPSLPRLPLKHFAAKIFGHTALLKHHKDDVDRLTSQFQAYKQEIPTCGAAMLNEAMDKVVMVRSWGNNARWGFPKGKLSKDETELDCAIREVFEETGFDMTGLVNCNTFYVDTLSSGRCSRMFVVTNVPEDAVFQTRTRKEISDIKWVPLWALPETPKAAKVQQRVAVMSTGPKRVVRDQNMMFSQYGTAPYTKKIRSWIEKQKQNGAGATSNSTGAKACGECTTVDTQDRLSNGVIGNVPDGAISVQELEASMVSGRGGGKSGCSRRDRRKSKRQAEHDEEARNRATFGDSSGSRMNEAEREELFRQYVIETDRIAKEKGLCDDLWPVPYITSKDFTEEQVENAEKARRKRELELAAKGNVVGTIVGDSKVVGEMAKGRGGGMNEGVPPDISGAFVFDRAAVLACLNSSLEA
eukprot:GFKZ01000678.1.p1 GENE.GFKZ01000678.1~~GFKZ01000678.1.p1  ORF type:complete len:474 (+),score=57.50 GFKZ01000678.1:395-1816(+)